MTSLSHRFVLVPAALWLTVVFGTVPAAEPDSGLKLDKGDRIIARSPRGLAGVSFSPDGRFVATGAGDGSVRLWDMAAGKEVREYRGHTGFQRSVVFSPDGKLLASGGDGEIILWDVARGEEVRRLSGHVNGVRRMAFSPDGKILASGGFDEHFRLWDVATGKVLREARAHPRVVYGIAFSPDGKLLATGGDHDGTIRLWDAATLREVRQWTAHEHCVYAVGFSPDGRFLASGGGDGAARIWEVATGREVRRFEGHESNQCHGVAFSPDGRLLLTGSYQRKAHLWDIAGGQQVRSFGDHGGWVWHVAYSPSGRSVASASSDGTVVVWELAPAPEAGPRRNFSQREMEDLWRDLAATDAGRAWRAVWTLSTGEPKVVAFLAERIRPVEAPRFDKQQVEQWVADLDSEEFAVRTRASAELEKVGEQAEEILRKGLKNAPSLEAHRRLEELVGKIERAEVPPERLRELRALQILAGIDGPEARKLLEEVASGHATAPLTQEARAVLSRLERRGGNP
jgi:Tol biopolymer transport system component